MTDQPRSVRRPSKLAACVGWTLLWGFLGIAALTGLLALAAGLGLLGPLR